MKVKKILISFFITHYNRPSDLLECLKAIKKLDLSHYEIVVSDDGSKTDVIERIKSFEIDKLLLSDFNRGLAGSINHGLKSCQGTYIIYCQEDFLLNKRIKDILHECISLLDADKVDLIRFTSNFEFNKLIPLSENVSLIPRFSIKNFFQNYYRYSDHPFIIKNGFHKAFGYYLENTSGRYGETEYAIRMCNSKVKIGITNHKFASLIEGSQSMLLSENNVKIKVYKTNKSLIKTARALRLYFEWLFYSKNKRGLITYKNGRKNQSDLNA